ncbi:5-oxoprolinase subunit B family protein [Demequina lignilytica]|uniref:Carboxyltransferase domain-containing protein n=1 Tax=Demequina lignilytica TaxID=3051663 RepID=A0AAW7M9G8_9MICO|nr:MULTISPECIES: carboxyltransferase domain-containing protein [unclassified Demequina]MDN4478677.1 carboxyltransferase domain-containing protein [Demequina sp. SYSU T00039-1]MDN4483229.1 carboxyltransferase domain-containing protein [Demequina sp. SYSU T0a273]MDN4488655.1 carboxyltransferase domain-containing protein [Demequina sp. SYSU T00039]MDN4491889.1 carboxyltransferase domain-containing protein [Demequina sp. SYSU T00068]
MPAPIVMGAAAVLVDCADADEVLAVHAEALRRREAGLLTAEEIVPAARTVLLAGVPDPAALAAAITGWELRAVDVAAGPVVEIPVRFDGPDLPDVAAHWGVTAPAAEATVLAAELTVAFCGFSPGFAYLTGLGREVPRRATPRTSVPAGSVALAGPYAGVYPQRSPGGWQIVGTAVGIEIWDVERDPAALLSPGTRVRFVAAT